MIGGRTVVVPQWALTVERRHLEALLAHALGHHLRRPPRAGGLVGRMVLLPLAGFPISRAWLKRRDERRADQMAAELGYGPDLTAVLRERMAEAELARVHASWFARLLATHPSPRDRILALGAHDLGQPGSRAPR